jgi:hypothetical protein
VNDGSATAEDIRRLVARCRDAVQRRFGVELREEIVYLGEIAVGAPAPGPRRSRPEKGPNVNAAD